MNRREVFASIAAGVIPVTASASPSLNKNKNDNFMVINLYVGRFSHNKVEAFANRIGEKFKKMIKEKGLNYHVIVNPSRTEPTSIEFHTTDPNAANDFYTYLISLNVEPEIIKDTPELRKEILDSVKILLGAPVKHLEITDEQLNLCFDNAHNDIAEYFSNYTEFHFHDAIRANNVGFLKNGVLAYATMCLALCRVNYELYSVGADLYKKWKEDMVS